MKQIKGSKRPLALLLAVILLLASITSPAAADGNMVELWPCRIVFRNKSLNAFGKTHRDMNIYQVNLAANAVPSLCIEEGRKIPDGSPARYEYYEVRPDQTIPVIGSFERFLSMALAYEWLVSGNYYDPARYGVTQVYYWGCMSGYGHNWAAQEQAMGKLQAVMGDGRVLPFYKEMRQYILDGEAEYKGTGGSSLPAWNGSVQKMTLKDGHYECTLDIGSCPQLRDTAWTFPDGNWSFQLSSDGNHITFLYNGAARPAGTVTSSELQGIEARYYAYLFTPAAASGLQTQFGWLDLERPAAAASFSVSDSEAPGLPGGQADLELYRHSETFESNYNITLEKYCAETDQPLEGTVFNVWEDFDFSQVNEDGYTEGAPDGTTGQVYLNRMDPAPESDYICDTMTTDTEGQAGHSDIRYYNYSKTYCMGHPAPEWIECDHEDDDECSCDEENERLRQQWMSEQELCAAACDFHVQNEDEDNHEQDTAAMEAMLADRDSTYEHFIGLEYSYHLEEKTARTGYILHGVHRDDEEIETVILASAQAGGGARSGRGYERSAAGRLMEPAYTAVTRMSGLRMFAYPLPEGKDPGVEELRDIISRVKEEKEPLPVKKLKENVDADGAAEAEEPEKEEQEADGSGEDGQTEGKGENEDEKGEESADRGDKGTDVENGETGDGEAGTAGTGNGGTGNGGTGSGEAGDAGAGNGGTGGAGTGSGGTGDAGTGNGGTGNTGTGNGGTGNGGTGNDGTGNTGTGNTGTGNDGTGNTGTGSGGTGNDGTGNTGTGNGGTGNDGTGNAGTGSREAGNKSSGTGTFIAGKTAESFQKTGGTGICTSQAYAYDSHQDSEAYISNHSRIILSSTDVMKDTIGKSGEDVKDAFGEDIKGAAGEEDGEGAEKREKEAAKEDGEEDAAAEGGDNTEEDDEDTEKDKDTDTDADADEIIEEYEYIRHPIHPSFETDISCGEQDQEPEPRGNAVTRFLASLFSDDDGDENITVYLPPFMDDSLGSMDVSAYGDSGDILYTFKVWDHRTEGRLHINKRDLELYRGDEDGSYGRTQGDATLEGAVYGLLAAQDILHPDGKSGVVYNQNDIVAVAATDKEGNASFLACTERPGTRLSQDGTLVVPESATGPDSLYDGSSITSSDLGFGTVTYPDYKTVNGDQWIGRPLILGSYYVMELSRSEGYELSVKGISLTESNRTQAGTATIREAGKAQISGGLSDYNNMDADGSWNDFIVESFKTEHGYDITVTGYPEDTAFYEIKTGTENRTFKVLLGSSLQQKTDDMGNPVYQTAQGGEYKTDSDGNPIIKTDTATDSSTDERIPWGETMMYRFRTAPYPSGSAKPEDISRWNQAVDGPYLAAQANGMLGQLRYKKVSAQSPWIDIELTGSTNAQAASEILDWFTRHGFYDCGAVDSVSQKEGRYYARLLYDYSAVSDLYPAVYDTVSRKLYVHKTAEAEGGPEAQTGYWIEYQKGEYHLNSRTVSVGEKREITGKIAYGSDIQAAISIVYQPVYETYRPGEIILDRGGNPIPVLERVYEYEDRTEACDTDILEPVNAVYDAETGTHTIHIENATDWSGVTESADTTFRAVTAQKTIQYEGMEMPYNQYLTDVAGAGVSAYASVPELDDGSYIIHQVLAYPGQNQPVQDGGTKEHPVQVLERVIKQSVKVTKDISQESYDGVNTYGALHNDPATVLLGLFNGGRDTRGTKILNQFKFKIYLKSNLEDIFIDEDGNIISEDIGTPDFKGDVQKVYLPPRNGGGKRLLETKEDGSYDYVKFLDAMYAAKQRQGDAYPAGQLRQFAIDYYDVAGYKEEILAAEPELNSDAAYDRALMRAQDEAGAYLDIFIGLESRLAIAWDRDAGGGADGDRTTLQCNTKNGDDDYYNHSIMLPYGTYIIAEQTAADMEKELANRHFNKDYPREVALPFVPDISADPNTGETETDYRAGSSYYRYDSGDTPQELIRKYKIRFNEENHIIQAHGQDGDFEVYKYGLDKDCRPGHSLTSSQPYEARYMDGRNETVEGYYAGYTSQSEDGGTRDHVIYEGYETDSGQLEVRDHVPVMTGVQTAVEGKYAPMLVPWTVLAPAVDRINPDTGGVETLTPAGRGEDFNFVAFAQEDFEDTYYSSKLRIEKLDAETGDNIIHDGALFKIYAAKRDVTKNGTNAVTGTGRVLFGEAVDWKGNPVTDADGKKILYPRVGQDNAGTDDLPIRLDRDGIPQYDVSQLIRQEDREGNETGIFKAYSTVREVVIDGQARQVPVGYIETYKPLGAGAYVLI